MVVIEEMDNSMFEHPNIRRRCDGSIDIDFYRQAALNERRLVMTNFTRGKSVHRGVIAVLLLAAAALYMAPSRDSTGWNEASAIGAQHNSAKPQLPSTSAHLHAIQTGE
jgi:hypothetical protein